MEARSSAGVSEAVAMGEPTDDGSRFRALATSAPIGIYELDRDGECRYVNDHWCELIGVGPEAAIGRGWERFIHPEDLEGVLARWTSASAAGREFAHEYRYVRPDGEVIWVEGRALPIRDGSGAVRGYVGFVVDVGDRRHAELRLAESARHFELSHDLIATCGFDGYFKRLNGAWPATLGWAVGELLPKRLIEIVHPEDRKTAIAEVARLAGGESRDSVRLRVAVRDGGWRWTEWSASPDVEAGLFYASGRDITDRVEAESALRRERRLFADAQQIARVGSWELEVASRGVVWSAQQALNHGFDPFEPPPTIEEFVARVHPDDRERLAALIAEALADPRPMTAEYRVVMPDGRIRVMEAQGQPFTDAAGGTRLAGTSRDVTAERDAERLKDDFFGLISHELRTPLTSIIGYTELLAEIETENLSPQGRRFVEVIERNSRRELSLVGDLLLLTRITAGTFEIEVGRADLGEIASVTVEAARPAATKAGVELVLDAPAGLVAEGDPHRLGQVVENLLSNAIKFTPSGGRVTVAIEPAGRGIALEIADTGIGIAEDDLARLFDRMYRSEEAERRHIQGTGLGLTIVKAIVDAHEATIAVHSEPGAGTRFRIELPRRVEAIDG